MAPKAGPAASLSRLWPVNREPRGRPGRPLLVVLKLSVPGAAPNQRSARRVRSCRRAAFGFVAEHPEADQPEGVPRGEIYEGGAEHGEIGRRRHDDVAGTHDQWHAQGADELAEIASA